MGVTMKTLYNKGLISTIQYDGAFHALPDGYSDWPDDFADFAQYKQGHNGVSIRSRPKVTESSEVLVSISDHESAITAFSFVPESTESVADQVVFEPNKPSTRASRRTRKTG